MRPTTRIAVIALAGALFLSGVTPTFAGPFRRSTPKDQQGINLNELPLPVIEAAQKEIPNLAFLKVQKQSSWRRGASYQIWAMDSKQRQVYVEIDAAGKVIERARLVKEKEMKEITRER